MSAARSIAFVCPRFAEGTTVGGAETLLRRLAERAAARGRTVHFLATCARDHFTWRNEIPAGTRRVGGMDVTFFPVDEDRDVETFLRVQNSICRRSAVTDADEQAWIRNSVNSRALCAHLAEHGAKYDRIVLGPYLFGLVYHAALVHPDRAILVPCLHDEPFAYVGIVRSMFQQVRGFMFNTEPEQALACRLYDLPAARCRVVGMGLDDFPSDPRAFARSRGISRPYVVYSGRREPMKGTPLLVGYMGLYRERTGDDVALVLTGSGPVDIPPALAPDAIDAGFLSDQDKHNAMAGAAVFCHPSVNESLSIVLLESWLARTPALVHAGSEVMSDQCRRSQGGLWFRTYPEFEEALRRLLHDEPLRRALGENGRRYVLAEYSVERIDGKLLAALDAG